MGYPNLNKSILNPPESYKFSDDFSGNTSSLIHLNALNIRNEICRQFISEYFRNKDSF